MKTVKTLPLDVEKFLEELSATGVKPSVLDGALTLRGSRRALTPDVIDRVTKQKDELVRYLSISALDVIKLLPTGKIDREQYLKAWQSLKDKPPN